MRFLLLFLAVFGLSTATASQAVKAGASETNHPEARPFDESANAVEQVDAALARAQLSGKRVIVVMGANWCHDSRGLSGWFAEPRFAAMLAVKYELVYVDVGMKDRNIDIARRFGIKSIKGTPTVLVLSSDGDLLNPKSAPKWRNAASREEDDIFVYFDQFAPEL
ncbi:thioredoxin family protein [uncultured Parasphingorhabdus sp.]|uniref:thioredoxin family protein n=1 Tax=uncultured Parasphingorhabdus sp. TaxID=2709694 RepID=UPI0030DA2BB5|tara:strand:+ start:162903 stop:163397 length:495 start_codon:yes stop_codon:yes gene_type:complete